MPRRDWLQGGDERGGAPTKKRRVLGDLSLCGDHQAEKAPLGWIEPDGEGAASATSVVVAKRSDRLGKSLTVSWCRCGEWECGVRPVVGDHHE